MSTPYNTGKVKIGAAYVPRIRPEVAQGFSGPHKRPFFEKSDRPVMWTCLLALLAFAVIVLSGCGRRTFSPEEVQRLKDQCTAMGGHFTAWAHDGAVERTICRIEGPR